MFSFQVKNDSDKFKKEFPSILDDETLEYDMYETNSIAWGAVVEILKLIADDVITAEEFRDISFNQGQEFDAKKSKIIGKRLVKYAKKLPEGERKYKTSKESMLAVGNATSDIQDEDDVFSYPNEAILEKWWLIKLGRLFIKSHGIYIS